MSYPRIPDFANLTRELELYAQLQHEHGARGISPLLAKAEKAMREAAVAIRKLPADRDLAAAEPDGLAAIRRLRPDGPRRQGRTLDLDSYSQRLEGALLGRCAGCTLGAPVEGWPIARMEALAEENGDAFPPADYWSYVPSPAELRYEMSRRDAYTRGKMNGVPVDDDLAYTLLGLLIVEEFGPEFTIEDVGRAWTKNLPHACTAERVALENLRAGVPAPRAAEHENPYTEWIGADIRADPWGYMAPGWPEKAAELAYRDASVSHRRNGVYGSMFFAASIAAAFTVDDPVQALEIGLTEIPAECSLARAVRWVLKTAPDVIGCREARELVDARFKGMHPVHTINNACLTVFGVAIGGRNFTKVIGETVAMGLDNDCTAATAGSLVGATIGAEAIPKKWTRHFNDVVHSYLVGKKKFAITGLLRRFEIQAARVHAIGA